MRAATLFSGIGAPECSMPHWDWLFHAEIEPSSSAVLAARVNGVNLGDVNAPDFIERAEALGRPDVIVFGSPCQDFSIAGKRVGLDGDRGNMALVALGVIAKLRTRWVVFENVPGLLSSYSGSAAEESEIRSRAESGLGFGESIDGFEDNDFAAFLATVQELGYLGAYRITDAQFAGVPQRRRRVFAVFHIGDWRPAVAVLLEPESLRGDHPPSREARQGTSHTIAPSLTSSGRGVERGGDTREQDPVVAVAVPLSEVRGDERRAGIPDMPMVRACAADDAGGITGAVSSKWAKGTGGPAGDECYNLVAAPLGAGSREGQRAPGMSADDAESLVFTADVSPPLNSVSGRRLPGTATDDVEQLIAFDPVQVTSPHNRSAASGDTASLHTSGPNLIAFDAKAGGDTSFAISREVAGALRGDGHGGGHAAICFTSKDYGADASVDHAPTLRAMEHDASHANGGGQLAVAFQTRIARNGRGNGEDVVPALNGADAGATSDMRPCVAYNITPSNSNKDYNAREARYAQAITTQSGVPSARGGDVITTTTAVRRLTPMECERLQGFPDHWTDVPYGGRNFKADGPRYRELGNAMCVKEIGAILKRIEMFEGLKACAQI